MSVTSSFGSEKDEKKEDHSLIDLSNKNTIDPGSIDTKAIQSYSIKMV